LINALTKVSDRNLTFLLPFHEKVIKLFYSIYPKKIHGTILVIITLQNVRIIMQ